jgi:putative colanic acid biosynthesis glycosyltransferase
VRFVYNGVDTTFFRPLRDESERDRLLFEMKIPDDGKPLLCFVANQVAFALKGLQHLVAAMEWLKESARFIVIGDKKGAEQLFHKSGRHEVIFTGFLPDKIQVSRWLKISDFFINPSISETFGLTNLESLSCGTRPIVFKLPVFHETLSDWGIFVDEIGGRELAEKITASLERKTTREMRSEAHKYVCDNFSEDLMCRHFVDIYQEKIMPAKPRQ